MDKVEKIASFCVDHDRIVPGIYISRIDKDITTYDLRTRTPNANSYIDDVTMHSVEHMLATFMRNSSISNNVIYFGPMGCRTGFYLLVRNEPKERVLDELILALEKTLKHEGEVFGANRTECGNYLCLDLESAKRECRMYLDILNSRNHDFKYY